MGYSAIKTVLLKLFLSSYFGDVLFSAKFTNKEEASRGSYT